ncbi:MAG: hypothetical protein AAB400_03635 [Patescibacteria group bacterium]
MIKRFVVTIALLNILMIVFHLVLGDRFDIFHLDRERTFVAYFTGLQHVSIAGGGVVLAWLSRNRLHWFGWIAFSATFIFLGFDEISELHENITYYALTYGPQFLHSTLLPFRSPTYNWLILFSPFIIAAVIFFVLWGAHIRNRQSRIYFFIGTALFALAIGLELLGGFVKGSFIPLFVIEESSEMFGATFFLWSVWEYAATLFSKQYERKHI